MKKMFPAVYIIKRFCPVYDRYAFGKACAAPLPLRFALRLLGFRVFSCIRRTGLLVYAKSVKEKEAQVSLY